MIAKYKSVAAFESALSQKLRTFVSADRTLQDIRKQVAFDRVLARLQYIAPDMWLLKGGVALEFRLDRARATADIDITTQADIDDLEAAFKSAEVTSFADYFSIRIGQRSRPVDGVATFRYKIDVLFAGGRLFEPVTVDVSFADPWLGVPQMVTGSPFLEFANIHPATVLAIPLGQHLAEKLHAYTRDYGSRSSTRVKDLVDMVLILEHRDFDMSEFAEFLPIVFEKRATHSIPVSLPAPPQNWDVPYRKLAPGLPIPQTVTGAFQSVGDKINDVLKSSNSPNLATARKIEPI